MTDEEPAEGPSIDEWEVRVQDVLAQLVHEGQQMMLTRFVCIYEAIDEAGERLTTYVGSPGIGVIDTGGLLLYATRSNNMAIDDGFRDAAPS